MPVWPWNPDQRLGSEVLWPPTSPCCPLLGGVRLRRFCLLTALPASASFFAPVDSTQWASLLLASASPAGWGTTQITESRCQSLGMTRKFTFLMSEADVQAWHWGAPVFVFSSCYCPVFLAELFVPSPYPSPADFTLRPQI